MVCAGDLEGISNESSQGSTLMNGGLTSLRDSERAVNTCVYACLAAREPFAAMSMNYKFLERCYLCFQDIMLCGV